jgi:hypothetical protein
MILLLLLCWLVVPKRARLLMRVRSNLCYVYMWEMDVDLGRLPYGKQMPPGPVCPHAGIHPTGYVYPFRDPAWYVAYRAMTPAAQKLWAR